MQMISNMNKNEPVMVTGATGYVAGALIKKLLENGITVHAAVREPENKSKVSHLKNLEQSTSGKIIFFESDLLKDGSYLQAMNGCAIVFHTASPFNFNIKDNKKGLIDPALKGTQNVLSSVDKTPSVNEKLGPKRKASSVFSLFDDEALFSLIVSGKVNVLSALLLFDSFD